MNDETICLLRCPHCGKIYKIVHIQYDSFGGEYLITDFGDKFKINIQTTIKPIMKEIGKEYIICTQTFVSLIEKHTKCIHCNKSFCITDNLSKTCITCEPWIADKIFTIKGG